MNSCKQRCFWTRSNWNFVFRVPSQNSSTCPSGPLGRDFFFLLPSVFHLVPSQLFRSVPSQVFRSVPFQNFQKKIKKKIQKNSNGFGVTLRQFWLCGSLLADFGFEGNFAPILGLEATLGQFWVWRSLWADFGFEGHIGSILGMGVTFGRFMVRESLRANFRFGGHFRSILGVGVTLDRIWVWGSLWPILGLRVTFGQFAFLMSFYLHNSTIKFCKQIFLRQNQNQQVIFMTNQMTVIKKFD